MSYYSVDIESDGQIPNLYSMVCFGAVKIDDKLDKTFYGKTKPISDLWIPDALAVSGFTREQHLEFDDPRDVMIRFEEFINSTTVGRPIFISDNNGFDWQFINYYFHYYLGRNPFGWSSKKISDIYAGMNKNMSESAKWRKLKTTKHTHHPLDDAMCVAEALIKMKQQGLKISLK